ncbi:glycine receptor subunit alpha-2-like [Lineus longissimus]|uniref:glycine receptor subunit alpha-2-like n=1 Tax=Lineus longissimus TaxID=88925 RepID=UPI00315D45F9
MGAYFILTFYTIQDYHIDFYFRQKWNDHRLAFNSTVDSITLGYYRTNDVWRPDTFFYNAKSGSLHDITVPNELFMLSPDGTVLTSQRIALVLTCNMYLDYFPMDNQSCHIIIGSYGYPARDITYKFMGDHSTTFETDMLLPEFIIDKTNVEQKDELLIYSTGNFSSLRFVLHMERDFGYYLIQTYVPSILIVLLSWVNFWLDIHATPARISLGLLTVLTMTTQSSGVNQQLPRVSYVKAIDVWMSTCLVFVFGALVEFACANVIARSQMNRATRKKVKREEQGEERTAALKTPNLKWTPLSHGINGRQKRDPHFSLTGVFDPTEIDYSISTGITNEGFSKESNGTSPLDPNAVNNEDLLYNIVQHNVRKKASKQKLTHAEKLELASRLLFPLAFGLFNLFYWLHYWCRWFESDRCRV